MTVIPDRLSTALEERYRLERELGAGGMATVYLAEDVRHHRKVAIKVLHPELSALLGPERFLKEIELTAGLQHPHVLPLFDSGNADGLLYYVMPYVEGETLRRRLEREQQLPIPDALRIATEVADALEYAHKRGVVHRDIKPENILLHDGRPLVADFGIALAVQQAGGTRMTQTGMSLGTPQYMAPEQAMGDKHVDHRADIYALGAVTYEMLTGEPPFTGPNSQAIVAKVLTTDPTPPAVKRRSVPPHIEHAVLTALDKMPADRFGTAAEFRTALSDARGAPGVRATLREPLLSRTRQRSWLLPAAALGLVAVTATVTWITKPAAESDRLPIQFAYQIDSSHQAGFLCCGYQVAVSPDEKQIVYVGFQRGVGQLYARQLDELVGHAIPGTEGAVEVFFSPDGNWLAFRARPAPGRGQARTAGEYELRKVPARGGSPLTIAATQGWPYGATWLPDGTIVFAGDGVLYRVPSDGGIPQRVGVPDSTYRYPSHVAGTNTVLYSRFRPGGPQIGVLDLDGGSERYLTDGVRAVYSRAGYMTFFRASTLVTQPYDPRGRRARDAPLTISDNVGRPVDYDVSARGLLVYYAGSGGGAADVVEEGVARSIPISVDATHFDSPRVSPDGRRIALVLGTSPGHQIVVHDIERNTTLRLTFTGNNEYISWTPDGLSLLYAGDSAVKIQPADRSAPERIVLSLSERRVGRVSVGGRWLAFAVRDPSNRSRSDIFISPTDSADARPYQSTSFNETAPALSPSGRWLAYVSDESGRPEVYASSVPVPGAREVISNNGGAEPVWSRDERTLYYRTLDGALVAVSVSGEASPRVSDRREILRSTHERADDDAAYDVFPDGRRFVMVRFARAGAQLVILTDAFKKAFQP